MPHKGTYGGKKPSSKTRAKAAASHGKAGKKTKNVSNKPMKYKKRKM